VPATDEAVALAVTAADAADDVKATDLTILDVADLLSLVDVFLLATASSDRQLKAMSERIEHRLREIDRKPLRREGTPASGWVLLDFGDLVCHLFSAEQRDFYSLERLWADVPRRDTSTGAPLPPGQRGGARPGADLDADPGADLDADVGADRAVGGS
jgi:ribosome-associated protein